MAHSTRASDDVPEWLKELVDCPERPDGMRVKDSPTDPLFIDLFLDAVRAFAARYDDDPYLEAVDVSLPGAWGEGHNLHLYPEDTFERIVKTYTEAFKNTRLLGQAAKPHLVLHPTAAIPMGWRGDGFGEPEHMKKTYPKYIEKIKDVWRVAPVSFESYWWIGEWKRQGWSIDDIIAHSLEWHASSFNAKSIPAPYEWKDKIDAWIAKMGYHFFTRSLTVPAFARRGEKLSLTLEIENVGVAPIYHKIPALIRLKNGNHTEIFDTGMDIREIMPGTTVKNIELTLPENMLPGEWEIAFGITGGIVDMIYLATDALRDGAFYKLGSLRVE